MKIDTVVGSKTRIKGDVKSSGAIRIDGRVEGSVNSGDGVIIGDSGTVHGNVRCKDAVVGGKIEGNLYVKNKVELLRTAHVQGDISYGRLLMEEGVQFDGRCARDKDSEPEKKNRWRGSSEAAS
jgi:cytoskeletal protein CcmA (bactofilin family)